MKLIHLEPIETGRGTAVILSEDTPESLEVTGADVDGLDDDYVIAVGSILVTPTRYYVAYEDGEFTAQGEDE